MPIVRRKLDPNTVYPTTIRYNPDTDTVQTDINGTWADSPEADPRHQTTLPPHLTSNPACDAAESVKDAFKAKIDDILTAITNSGTAFTIAGIILSLFTFGVFGIFISIALAIGNGMLSAGTTAIEAALTDPIYHTFACILFCHMDSNGRLTSDTLSAAEADVTAQIGGLGATILNGMLALAGEGGVNNLAALGMSTGDCDDCECVWCYKFQFQDTDGSFTQYPGTGGSYIAAEGWVSDLWVGGDGNTYRAVDLQKTFSAHITHVTVEVSVDTAPTNPYPSGWVTVQTSVGTIIAAGATPGVPDLYTFSWDGSQDVTGINQLFAAAGYHNGTGTDPGGQVTLRSILFRGTGDNPFGMDNCP